jgi:hypothetical protein
VDITIRVVDFVGGGIVNPDIDGYPKLVFVDVRVWTQLKMSDIEDPGERISEGTVEIPDEKRTFSQ